MPLLELAPVCVRHAQAGNAQGRIKDMAARTLLLKLERRGCIELPARQRPSSNQFRNQRVPVVQPACEPIRGNLSDLRPLSVSLVAPRSEELGLFKGLLGQYHYLGHRNTVGDLPTGRQGTCVIWSATGTGGMWPVRCSVRRHGNARIAIAFSGGIGRAVNATFRQ